MPVTKTWWKLAVCASFLANSCGRDTNVNQIFKVSGEDDRIDTLVSLGRIHYDRGEHDKAEVYASKAYEINHNSEKAAILYAYVLLGQVGIDPFSMTKSMMAKTASATTALAADSTSGADALSQFSSLINIDQAGLAAMTTKSVSENAFFKDYPIYIPIKPDAEGGPRLANSTLVHIKKAVQVICPFVAKAARVEGYAVHDCVDATGEMKYQSKSHFLWALAHLGEALAFNSVMFYDGGASETTLAETAAPSTGIFRRAAALNKTSFVGDEIASYVAAVVELKSNIDQVFNTSTDSMLYATLSDLTAVSLAFAAIAGIPDSVTSKIQAGLATVEKLGKTLSGGADSALSQQTEALKLQMNKTVNTKLKSSIDVFNKQYSDQATIDALPAAEQAKIAENKESLCTSYKTLSGYSAGDTSVELPTGC